MSGEPELPEQAEDLRQLAQRCRRLASMLAEPDESRISNYAAELEAQAAELDRDRKSQQHGSPDAHTAVH